jgi:hypothetical protein
VSHENEIPVIARPLRLAALAVGIAVAIPGISSCSSSRVSTDLPQTTCLPGDTTGCVPPDAVVQFRPTVTLGQILQYQQNLTPTMANGVNLGGMNLVIDAPRNRALVSWPRSWTVAQQQALMKLLASSQYVQSVDRV